MTEQHRKCVKCGVTAAQDPSLTFHRFPDIGKGRPETLLRARIWAEFSYPEKNCFDKDFLRTLHTSHKVLCSKHFAADSFASGTRLNKFSIPIGMEPALQELRNEAGSSEKVSPTPGPSSMVQDTAYVAETVLVSPTPGPSSMVQDTAYVAETVLVSPTPGPSSMVQDTAYVAETVLVSPTPGPSSMVQDTAYVAETVLVGQTVGPSKALEVEKYDEGDVPVCGAPKRGILQPLGVKRVGDLNPREQKLYKLCRQSLQKLCVLKKKLKQQKKPTKNIQKLVDNENIKRIFGSKISDSLVLLLQSQIKNCPKKPKGRRFNLEEKILALTLYKKSPACYRLLRRLFSLPCQSTLKSLLNRVPLKPGINNQIFNGLAEMVQNHEEKENICTLIFDEMSIQKNLTYNKKLDIVEGYQDHGKQGRSQEVASKALVFMVSGIRKKWKQPVAYYLSSNYTTAERLAVLIKEVLKECFTAGLTVVSTVCDLSRVNIKALDILGSSKDYPFFYLKIRRS